MLGHPKEGRIDGSLWAVTPPPCSPQPRPSPCEAQRSPSQPLLFAGGGNAESWVYSLRTAAAGPRVVREVNSGHRAGTRVRPRSTGAACRICLRREVPSLSRVFLSLWEATSLPGAFPRTRWLRHSPSLIPAPCAPSAGADRRPWGGHQGHIQPRRFAAKVRLALLAGPFWDEARGLFNQKARANFLARVRG